MSPPTDTIWRAMTPGDLDAAFFMSKIIHPAFPEDFDILAEKFRLFPTGCLFAAGVGYAVSHPWAGPPPPLNRFLTALPPHPTHHYIHDVAILPDARGRNFATQAVMRIKAGAHAHGLRQMALVAVNASVPFWQKQGFAVARLAGEKLASYGPDARYMSAAT